MTMSRSIHGAADDILSFRWLSNIPVYTCTTSPLVARGEGIVRDFRKVMDTRIYLKWITNKDLPNSAHCYVTAWIGGGFGHMYMYG